MKVFSYMCGGAVTSWLVCSPLYQVVWIQSLARVIVLCSWAHFTLTVPLFTLVYKWVPVNVMLGGWGGNPAMD